MTAKSFLDYLNIKYHKLHTAFENSFWDFRMGINTDGSKMNKAEQARDGFRSNKKLKEQTESYIPKAKGEIKRRLKIWNDFFSLYQIPDHAVAIRKKVALIEEKILNQQGSRKEGYIDPASGNFVESSMNKMRLTMRSNPDENIRRACFEAIEAMPLGTLDDYIEVIKYRNEYARALGYEDFYDYKIHLDEGISKDELFKIFEKIYDKTKFAFDSIRKLEIEKPGLRKPWNFGYMISGNLIKEEDQYFQFEDVLSYWGKTFSAMGIDYAGGELKLDLLDRKGKWNNGFCHYPKLICYSDKGKILPASSNFTSNAIPSELGSGINGINTVFHEAGHAADRLNSIQQDVCLNHEYPPSTVSWSETHSMFMDSISSSIEWRMRYAKNKNGESYPFELFEKKLKSVIDIIPLEMMGIISVMDFERRIYECKDLTRDFVLNTAKEINKKYFDYSEPSLSLLNVPHIYSWESSAYYHGYGLAEIAVSQWREYFFKKYGYIIDNPKVGKEMKKVWKYGSLYKSNKFIKIATGKSLDPDSYIKDITRTYEKRVLDAKKRISNLNKIPLNNKSIKLNAKISIVHGKEKIADNKKSFEDMDNKFKAWIRSLK
jgi:Zn-dependent oligopeptidase